MQYFGTSIVTTSNSVYRVDWDRRLVSGGNLQGVFPFTDGFCAEGERMRLNLGGLLSGKTLVTSTVTNIRQESAGVSNVHAQRKCVGNLFKLFSRAE